MGREFLTLLKDDNGAYRGVQYEPLHVIAGDTDSALLDFSGAFSSDAPVASVVEAADSIAEEINRGFPDFVMDVFNVKPMNATIVQNTREVCADRSVFVGKKQYIMHVVNSEGVDCDKMKIMGLAIKKTDTPKVIQECMGEIVRMMLAGMPSIEVQKYIDSFKERFYTLPLSEVGIPTSVKSLKKYADQLNDNPTMKGFPGHVRASLIYNSRCGPNDIKIRPGDKVKVGYVLDDPYGKAIAIPSDAEVLPDFISDLRINRARHWEYATGKIDTLIVPVGYDRKTRQNDFLAEMFGI